jgi:hypothetical protein
MRGAAPLIKVFILSKKNKLLKSKSFISLENYYNNITTLA